MIPLKKPEMQGAKFSRNEDVLIVRRSDLSACNAQAGWKIEAMPQIRFFQRNHIWHDSLLCRRGI